MSSDARRSLPCALLKCALVVLVVVGITQLSADVSDKQALTLCIAILTFKATLVHLLTVRARLYHDTFAVKSEASNFYGIILKLVTFPIEGTGVGPDAVARFERCARNNAENEPIFAVLATASMNFALSNNFESARWLVLMFTWARVVHT
ncbi:MAG: hypothetical protein SGPRY_012799, partial [Prymnesium sp.]